MDVLTTPKLPLAKWLAVIEREYLTAFVPAGGASVKFVVLDDQAIGAAKDGVNGLGHAHGMLAVDIDAGSTRINLMQEIFFAVARAMPWERLLQRYVERLFTLNAYAWPHPGAEMTMGDLAMLFGVAPSLLARQRDQWLTADLWGDRRLAQDFRAALLRLCLSRLEADGSDMAGPVLQWLRGEKVPAASLRMADISGRITRTNARAMLASLCQFLAKIATPGLLVVLDAKQLSRSAPSEAGLRYSLAAVMDSYEVLREIIDDVEHLPGLLLIVLTDAALAIGDPRRALSQYAALQMRIWPDVRPGDRQNPVAPLVWAGGMTLEARMAIEAMRAGVPNQAAIRQMGTEQTGIELGFETALASAWNEPGMAHAGIGLAGGFGTGKSHLLGYLAEVSRQQGFIVSKVAVSKETPLSHPGHVLAAALRNAILPDRPDDPVPACISVLRERREALETLENLVSVPAGGFAPIFAACIFLLGRPATTPEMLRRIGRLWSGAKVSVPAIRQALTAAGAGRMFQLGQVQAGDMTSQMTRFLPLLFRAAGYGGWCILFDEVELIGRYTPLQRAMAYAWLARWLGLNGAGMSGLVAAYAITDDFATAVINARLDSEKLPERLMLKGRDTDATLALAGIAHIEQTVLQHRLLSPTPDDLVVCHDKARTLYSSAYGWPAPALAPPERTSSRTMRQYIKGWITQWDLRRLDGSEIGLVAESIASNYAEEPNLEEPPPLDTEAGLDHDPSARSS